MNTAVSVKLKKFCNINHKIKEMVHLEPIKKILMQANTTYGKAGVAASDKKKNIIK